MKPNVLNSEKIRDKTAVAEGEEKPERDTHWMTTDESGHPIEVGELCMRMGKKVVILGFLGKNIEKI